MHQAVRGAAGQGAVVIAWARQHRDRDVSGELQPATPAGELLQNVSAHQPDEPGAGEAAAEQVQRVDRVMGAEGGLNRTGDDAAAVGDPAGGGQALLEWRHPAVRLQRIAWRDQQPDLVEPQASSGDVNDVAMARMGWIEGAAEQADARAPPVAEARQLFVPDGLVQGRTWPVPRTR
jgi:hypothetical protein